MGFLIGMIVELFIDAETVRDLQDHDRKLRLENAQLRNEIKHEVIEINDPNFRVYEPSELTKEDFEKVNDLYADYFKPF